jgi:hypothetical protein
MEGMYWTLVTNLFSDPNFPRRTKLYDEMGVYFRKQQLYEAECSMARKEIEMTFDKHNYRVQKVAILSILELNSKLKEL